MIYKSILKKLFCLVLCFMFAFPGTLAAEAGKDYEGHLAEESIKVLFEKGFVTGYTDGTFKPEAQISRAEFMAIVNRAFAYNDKADISFKDVKEGEWYHDHIARAVKAGYIIGYTDGTIKPASNITRQEVSVILARILGLEETADIKVLASIKDGDKIQEWSAKGIAAIISKGYIKLNNEGFFEATKPLTRAEMAVAVEKSYVKQIKKVYTEPGIFTGGNIDGSVKIDNKDITLKDTTINGDLTLGEGIGEGSVHLINVSVKGDTIVNGGGENSIIIENCQFSKIIIIKENNKIRILAKGNTKVDAINVQSGAKLESENLQGEGFGYVTIAEGLDDDALVELIGNFESVEIRADGIQMQASGGTIANLEVAKTATNVAIALASDSRVTTFQTDAATTITGTGRIETAQVNVSGTTIGVPVTNVEKPADVTVNAGTSTTPVTTPSAGGGSGGTSNNNNDDDDNYTPTIPVIKSTTSTIANGSANPVVVITLENDTFTAEGISNIPANWTGSLGTTGLTGCTITRNSDTQITFQLNGTAKAGTLTLQANAAALTGGVASNTITITVPEASEITVAINEINTAMVDMRKGSIIMGYTFSGDAGVITYEQAISDAYALDLENSYVTLAKYDGTSYTQIGSTINLSTLIIGNSNVEGESAKVTFEDFEMLLNVFGLDFSNPANIPSHEKVVVKSKTTIAGSDVANPWGPIDSGWIAIDSELIYPVGVSTENSTATIEPGNKTAGIPFPVNIHIKDESNANLPDGDYSVQILNGDTPAGGGAEIDFIGGQASVDAILATEGTYTLLVKVNNTEIECIANTVAVSSPVLDVVTTTMDGTQILLTFSKEMADPSGNGNQFTIMVDGIENPIAAAALKTGDSKTIELTLTNHLHGGETINISYERGDVTAADGGILCTFIPTVVTNSVPETVLITEITVAGAEGAMEVANGETLQMIATVSPGDASDTSITWSIINGTGSATISEDGLLAGTGAGTVTVKATANDGSGIVGERAITITNNAPVATDDTAEVDEDSTVLVDVLVNDTDVDGDTLSITSFTQGTNGTVTQEGDSLRYTPDADYNGADSFMYEINDGMGGTATATVNVMVNAALIIPPDGGLLDSAAGSDFIGVLYTRDGNIYYNQADSSGTWGSETLIGTGTEGRLAIDSLDSPHAAYTTSGKIGYRMYDGSSWTAEELIISNNGGTCSKPDIAVDSSGYAHITYTDTMGNQGDDYDKPDIMYAHNTSGIFVKELIFNGYGYYNFFNKVDYTYFNGGSVIDVTDDGNYFIAAHYHFYENSSGIYHTYSIQVKSNLGSGSTTTSSSNIFDVYDLTSNGNKVVILYKQSSFKTSELTVSGTTINFTNTTELTGSSVNSVATDGTDVAVGGLSSANLQTHYNGTAQVYNEIVVKTATKVSVVNLNGTFYAVYTDNGDNIIKIMEI